MGNSGKCFFRCCHSERENYFINKKRHSKVCMWLHLPNLKFKLICESILLKSYVKVSVVFFTLQTYYRLTETHSSRGGGWGIGNKSGPERAAEIQP